MESVERQRLDLIAENDAARRLSESGFDVRQNPTLSEGRTPDRSGFTPAGKKDPDYLIEGHYFDCYTPGPGADPKKVAAKVAEKVGSGQTQRVVLNLERAPNLDLAGLEAQLKEDFAVRLRAQAEEPSLQQKWVREVIVLTPDGIQHVWP